MKRFISIGIIFLLFHSISFGQSFENIDQAWDWYKNLDPILQLALEMGNNDAKKIKKKDLQTLLPFKNANLSPFKISGWTSLDIIKDLTEIQKLSIPENIKDYSLIEEGHFPRIEYLYIEGNSFSPEDLEKFKLPNLRILDISKTNLNTPDFADNFPNLAVIQMSPGQISDKEISRFDRISFSTPDFPVLPRKDWESKDFFQYTKNVQYPIGAAEKKVSGKAIVLAHVNPQGEVVDVENVSNLGQGIEEEFSRIVKTVRFERVDESLGIQKIEMSMIFKLK